MPDDRDNANLRKRLQAFSVLWGDQAARSLELFDKFNALGFGQKAYYFILRLRMNQDIMNQNLKSGLDRLEGVYEKYGKEEGKRKMIGIELFLALR